MAKLNWNNKNLNEIVKMKIKAGQIKWIVSKFEYKMTLRKIIIQIKMNLWLAEINCGDNQHVMKIV